MSATNAIATEFDAKAEVYESSRLASWYMAHAQIVLEALRPLSSGEVVLDVGCGTGYLLRRLAAERVDCTAIGLDLSSAMVRVARAKADAAGLSALTFVQADFEDPGARTRALAGLPQPTRVVCSSALHYFAEPQAALAAMYDVLQPGGEVLILERATERSPLTRLWGHLHHHLIRDHVTFHDSDALIGMLRAAGFAAAGVRSRLNKRFWKGKLYTSLVLIGAVRSGPLDLSHPDQPGSP